MPGCGPTSPASLPPPPAPGRPLSLPPPPSCLPPSSSLAPHSQHHATMPATPSAPPLPPNNNPAEPASHLKCWIWVAGCAQVGHRRRERAVHAALAAARRAHLRWLGGGRRGRAPNRRRALCRWHAAVQWACSVLPLSLPRPTPIPVGMVPSKTNFWTLDPGPWALGPGLSPWLTSMVPKRTASVCHSCEALAMKDGTACSPEALQAATSAPWGCWRAQGTGQAWHKLAATSS